MNECRFNTLKSGQSVRYDVNSNSNSGHSFQDNDDVGDDFPGDKTRSFDVCVASHSSCSLTSAEMVFVSPCLNQFVASSSCPSSAPPLPLHRNCKGTCKWVVLTEW